MATPNVNVPTNDKVKDADINQKTQLYGIYRAFAMGKAPSNKQIDVAMNSALASKALSNPNKDLSSDGKQLVADLRNVVEQAKVLFLTKNEGNLLQDFAWQCQQVGQGDAKVPGAPVDKDTAKQHGDEALEGLRTLGQLIITNGQFRKLLNDIVILGRDMAGDAAQKAANKVNPSEDQLAQIDEPAEDNTWHDSPDFQGMKDKYKSKVDEVRSKGKSAASDAQQDAQSEGNTGGATAAKDKMKSTIPEEQREKAKEQYERTKGYLKDKVPEERRDQTINRLKKMIVEIQGHEDYQRAIDTLLRLAETYSGHTKSVAGDSAGAVKGAHSGNDGLNAAEADLRIVLERFANSTSMDDIFDSLNQIYRDADADPELKSFFRDLNHYVRKCLKEQGYVLKDEANEEWNRLSEKGKFLLKERYKDHTQRILDEFKFFGEQFDKDPQNKAFADSMNKLFNDLGTDRNGKAEFKPHLLKDIRDIIIPGIINSIRYIPIPDFEFTSTDADFVVRDLVVEADNVFPNIIDVTSNNFFRFGRKKVKSANSNNFAIHVAGIQTHLTNIRFYAKSKKGLAMRNWGLVDVTLADTGLEFGIDLATAEKSDKAHFFKVKKVDIKISKLKLDFREQHHPILTKVAALFAKGPVLSGPIKKVLEAKIKQAVEDFDAFCYGVHQDVQKAKESAKNDPEQAQNVFKQYFDAYQQKMTRQKQDKERKAEKAKQVAKEKEVQTNIAFLKEQRISKDWNNGKGIPIDEQEKNSPAAGKFTAKTQEYLDLARQGQKWESPVFGLGSAQPSASLPKAAPITRKQHETAPSQVRGGTGTDRGSSTGNITGSTTTSPATGTPANYGQVDGSITNGNYSRANGGIDEKSGTAGAGNLGPSGLGQNSTKTTLGVSNPVLTGSV